MRVIAGSARSLKLKTLPSDKTRPTTDRIKETLFNMLMPDIAGAHFLDLFSGSGAIGIEALSRGAREAVFVENSRDAMRIIRENLLFTKLSERARLLEEDVLSAIRRLSSGIEEPFDIIFMDPPYGRELEKAVLTALKGTKILTEHTILIAEASSKTDFSYVDALGYRVFKEKVYGSNKHIWLKIKD